MNVRDLPKFFLPALLSAVVTGSAGRANALDRDLAYLHALQSRGYGDVAVGYLDSLGKKNEMPPAVKEVFELEMSRSLRSEAQTTPDPRNAAGSWPAARNISTSSSRTTPTIPRPCKRRSRRPR